MTFHRVCTLDDVWSGEKIAVEARGRSLLVINIDGVVCVYEDRCCHKGVRLSEGRLDGHVLTCAAHGWQYDARTGQGINPQVVFLRRYAVKMEGDEIWVDLPEGAPHGP